MTRIIITPTADKSGTKRIFIALCALFPDWEVSLEDGAVATEPPQIELLPTDASPSITDPEVSATPPTIDDPDLPDFYVKGNAKWRLNEAQYEAVLTAYRHLSEAEVLEQLNKAALWTLSNPLQRKTKAGMMRFVNGWLARYKPEQRAKRLADEACAGAVSIDDFMRMTAE